LSQGEIAPKMEGAWAPSRSVGKGLRLLTEQQIAKSWRILFSTSSFDSEVAAKAEALLDELRPESPLRHRLRAELDELRKMKLQKVH